MERTPRPSHFAYLLYVGSHGHQSAPDSKCEFCLSPPWSHGQQGSLLYGWEKEAKITTREMEAAPDSAPYPS